MLSDLNANVIKLEHNQFKAMDRYLHVQLEVTVETNGHKHIQEILSKLEEENFTYKRIY